MSAATPTVTDTATGRIGTSAERDLREHLGQRGRVLADRRFWLAAALGLGWVAGYAALTAAGRNSPALAQFVGEVLYQVPIAAAAGLSFAAARRTRCRSARMWRVLAIATVAWLGGEIVWSTYAFRTPDAMPYPSVADALYLLSYALAIPAVLIGFGSAGSLRQVRGLLDTGLLVVALAALGWQFLLRPQVVGPVDAGTALSAAYPLLDATLVGCLVAVGLAGHRLVPYPVLLVGAAYACAAVSDAGYTYLVVVRGFDVAHWLNLGWQTQAVLLSLAALVAVRHREGDARAVPLDRDYTLVPLLVSALASFVLVAADQARTGGVHRSTLAVAAVMVAGTLLRQYLFAKDRSRLARQLQTALREQERLAVTDGLTGLYNRRFLLEMLKLEADRSARGRRPLSLAVIDLDHFKLVNDTHGHPVGDAVLVQAADRIRQVSRNSDIVARYGGEEFVVLLPDTDDEVAVELAERFRQALRRAPVTAAHGRDITVTGSVGVATAAPDARTGLLNTERLVADADRALYQAKATGRDRTVAAGGPAAEAAGAFDVPSSLLWIADRIDGSLGSHEHSTAVERWCVLLGRELGLAQAELAMLAAAGRLHDIGKISVDEAILRKPGSLDADEWAELRRHCEEGGRLLRDLGHCRELAPMVEAHHERYDGRGYPSGLAGDEIPLEARIIAVCDSWAAMRVDRAYARGKTVAAARREILAGRGGQFDPAVADAFLALVDRGLVDEPRPLRQDPRAAEGTPAPSPNGAMTPAVGAG